MSVPAFTEGAIVSTVNVLDAAFAFDVVFEYPSVERIYIVCDPSERDVAAQVKGSLVPLKLASFAVQLDQLPPVPSI